MGNMLIFSILFSGCTGVEPTAFYGCSYGIELDELFVSPDNDEIWAAETAALGGVNYLGLGLEPGHVGDKGVLQFSVDDMALERIAFLDLFPDKYEPQGPFVVPVGSSAFGGGFYVDETAFWASIQVSFSSDLQMRVEYPALGHLVTADFAIESECSPF